MKVKIKLNILLVVCLTILIFSSTIVYADSMSGVEVKNYISQNSSFPNDAHYFISNTEYVYKNSSGNTGSTLKVETLLKNVKVAYYEKFIKSYQGKFRDTAILEGYSYSGGSRLGNANPLETGLASLCYGEGQESGYFNIVSLNGEKMRFYLPEGSLPEYEEFRNPDGTMTSEIVGYTKKTSYEFGRPYPNNDFTRNKDLYICEGSIIDASSYNVGRFITAVKEGVIAGGIEAGINVGSVYSDNQTPLGRVMEPDKGGSSPSASDDNAEVVKPSPGGVFKFKNTNTIKASLDFFFSPLFGKIKIEDMPQTDAAWNKLINEINISGVAIEINDAYMQFLNNIGPDALGLRDAENIKFTNGVKAYKDGLTTKEPISRVNYNMRIALPHSFTLVGENSYKLDESNLHLLSDYRMSIYNDVIYKEKEDGELVQVCTNADLDLDRAYIVFFNQKINGVPLGVVVVLRYEEGVYDTTDNSRYLTGRKVAFGGSYSDALKINSLNRDILYTETKTSGKEAYNPKFSAFLTSAEGVGKLESLYKNKSNHKEILGTPRTLAYYIDFVEIDNIVKASESQESTEQEVLDYDEDGNPVHKGKTQNNAEVNTKKRSFVMFRNNFYVNEGQLLNWLSSDEARAIPFVKAEELRQKIRGEFSTGITKLTYSEWLKMQNIKSQLSREKSMLLPSYIRILSVVFGTFLIIFAVLLILAYWLDIFNTLTDKSILYAISFGNMYPIEDRDNMPYISQRTGATKFVTLKDIIVIATLCCMLGGVFMNVTFVIGLFLRIYVYITQLLLK